MAILLSIVFVFYVLCIVFMIKWYQKSIKKDKEIKRLIIEIKSNLDKLENIYKKRKEFENDKIRMN